MKKWTVVILTLAFVSTQLGCATYVAVKMSGPANDEAVQLGMHRRDIESVLGVGPVSEYEDEGFTTIRYEYSDGPPQATKVRSLVYIAGDIFSAFLSEIIFWPIELYADRQIQRVATAEYDDQNRLVAWTLERRNGEKLQPRIASAARDEADAGKTDVSAAPPEPALDGFSEEAGLEGQ